MAINNVYNAILDYPTKGLNAINLRTLVMHILNTYAQISQPDLDDNMTNFYSGIYSAPPPRSLHEEAGEVSGLCRQCRCPHL